MARGYGSTKEILRGPRSEWHRKEVGRLLRAQLATQMTAVGQKSRGSIRIIAIAAIVTLVVAVPSRADALHAPIALPRDGRLGVSPHPAIIRVPGPANLPGLTSCPTAFEIEVGHLINEERASRGLAPVDLEAHLVEAARLHSQDMAANGYFSHDSQDGRTFADRIEEAGYAWTAAGEIIAAGYASPEDVVQGWMNSSGHRGILLGSSYEHVGVGYAYQAGSPYGHYWTADFGASSAGGQAPAQCGSFSDVPQDYWAYAYIEALREAGLTGGYADGTYRPENPVTRAEMAVFLERGMRGSAYEPPTANGEAFGDISASYWASDWIEQLYSDGITSGCSTSPRQYCPEQVVSRAEMSIFLERAKQWPDISSPQNGSGTIFADVDAAHWAGAWIEELYRDGITGGCSLDPPMYCPRSEVTRGEMAVFLVKAFDLPLP